MVEWDTLFCHSPLICNQESSQLGKDGYTTQTRTWEFHTSVHLKVGGRKHIEKAKSRKSKNGAYDPNPCCNSWTYGSPREPNSYRKAAHTTLASWQKQYSSIFSVQFISVQSLSRVWLCNPMNCSTPGLPVHQQLPEFTQTHVHWVSDAIQPSYPLWSPSPPAFSLSQHQGFFQWVSSSHQVAKVLEFQL